MKAITNEGDLYTLEEFARAVQDGSLIDTDGIGRLADATHYYAIAATPSTFSIKQALDFNCGFTHVLWFNK